VYFIPVILREGLRERERKTKRGRDGRREKKGVGERWGTLFRCVPFNYFESKNI
jgi:hypothetical protein